MLIKILSILLSFSLILGLDARPKKKKIKKNKTNTYIIKKKKLSFKNKKVDSLYPNYDVYNKVAEEKKLLEQVKNTKDLESKAQLYQSLSNIFLDASTLEEYKKAILYAKKAINTSKTKSTYYAHLGYIYSVLKPIDMLSVKQSYMKAIETSESNYMKATHYAAIANAYSSNEFPNFNESEKYLLKAVELSETDFDKSNFYFNLANIFYFDEEKFYLYMNKSIEFSNDNESKAGNFYSLGYFYLNPNKVITEENFKKGSELIEKAIALTNISYNKSAWLHSILYSYKRMQINHDIQKLISLYNQLIDYSITSQEKSGYHAELGMFYAEQENPNFQLAIEEFNKAILKAGDEFTISNYKEKIKILKFRMKAKD